MAKWYDRAKARMAELEIRQDDLLKVFGVTTRGAVGHYLSGRRDPPTDALVRLADRLNLSLDTLLRGEPASQSGGMDLPMLSEALVSLDKALRAKGLEYNAAYVAPALMLAYEERMRHPAKLDAASYALYDRLVLQQLEGQQVQHERDGGGIAEVGTGGARKASSSRAASRRGR